MTHSKTAPSGRAALRVRATDVGLAPDTTVLTADGAIPAAYLNAGDRVITRRGMRTLRAVVRRKLDASAARVLVRADALGGKPERDVLLMPKQRVLVRDWRAKALWGRDVAAPEVTRLVDGRFVTRVHPAEATQVLALYFGAPEVIYADGLELASADAVARARAGSQSAAKT